MSFVAAFREDMGRGLDVSWETLDKMIDYGQNYGKTGFTGEQDATTSSLGRLLVNPNVAAIYMTPEVVPYRGVAYMSDEIKATFTLSGENNPMLMRGRNFGTGVATRYGFSVNRTTSVEWPIFADGYSRFGFIGLFLYSMIFAFTLSVFEKCAKRVWYRNPLLSLTFLLFIWYNGVLSYQFSYYAFYKLLVFRLTLVAMTTYILGICARKKINL